MILGGTPRSREPGKAALGGLGEVDPVRFRGRVALRVATSGFEPAASHVFEGIFSCVCELRRISSRQSVRDDQGKHGENATVTKHGFEDGSSINEPDLSSQSDAIDLELQTGLPPTVESPWGSEPVLSESGACHGRDRPAFLAPSARDGQK